MSEPMEGVAQIDSADIPDGSVTVNEVSEEVLQDCRAPGTMTYLYLNFN